MLQHTLERDMSSWVFYNQMAYITSDMFFGTMGALFRYKVQADMGGDGVCALKKDTQNRETTSRETTSRENEL